MVAAPPSLLKYGCRSRSLSAVMLTVILWGWGSALLTSSFGELHWMDMIMSRPLYQETIVNTNISVVLSCSQSTIISKKNEFITQLANMESKTYVRIAVFKARRLQNDRINHHISP